MLLPSQWVASVDLFPNEEAHANVVVTKTDSWTEQNEEVRHMVDKIIETNYCTVISMAGTLHLKT